MTNQEAISYLCNLRVAIGRTEHQALWHYEQSLAEIIDMLSEEPKYAEPRIIRCKDCKHWMREKLEGFELPYGDCESPDIRDCIRGNAYDVIAFQTNEDFYCGFAMAEDSEGEE